MASQWVGAGYELQTQVIGGGAEEDRTPDLLRARQALSQLSYGPVVLSERPELHNAESLL